MVLLLADSTISIAPNSITKSNLTFRNNLHSSAYPRPQLTGNALFPKDDPEPVTADKLKHVLEEKRILGDAKELENLSKWKEMEDTDIVDKDNKKEKNHDNIKYKLKENVAVGGSRLVMGLGMIVACVS